MRKPRLGNRKGLGPRPHSHSQLVAEVAWSPDDRALVPIPLNPYPTLRFSKQPEISPKA